MIFDSLEKLPGNEVKLTGETMEIKGHSPLRLSLQNGTARFAPAPCLKQKTLTSKYDPERTQTS